jgi:hypothetical protein
VSAGLLAVALDLLATTLIACPCYSPPLLHGLWLWLLIVADIVARRILFGVFGAVVVLSRVILTRLAGACW